MSFDYKNVLNPTGQVDQHILREMLDDIKLYINDDLEGDLSFASTELDNLGTVAINTSLLSDTSGADDLGSSSSLWKDLYLDGSIKHGSNTAITIINTGAVTQPNQPSFLVTAPVNTQNTTGDGSAHTVEFDTEVYDLSSNFNTSTFSFSAPTSGKYQLNANVYVQGLDGTQTTVSRAVIVTSNRNYTGNASIESSNSTRAVMSVSVIADMDASDTAHVTVTFGSGNKVVETYNDATRTYFSGSLIN